MALLEVKNITLGYDRPLLQDICLRAEEGEVVGILGRNGCGKTTLLRGIAGNGKRFAGEIWIRGRNCAAMTAKQQARLLSMLPQQTQLLPGISVRELLKMGRYPHQRLFRPDVPAAAVEAAARQMGISHLLDADCSCLSQGQRQLALLARLLVQDTPVMLLDEPDTALDYDNTHTMYARIRRIVREKRKAALLVLHDPDLALRYCDRILIMKDGAIVKNVRCCADAQRELGEALQTLYPKLILQRDPQWGTFRCCYPTQIHEEGNSC